MTLKEPFEQTVQRHGATVLRVCRAVLGPGADSEDAWSETFLAALRAWPDLDKNTNVQAWLVRVAQRKAIDITRTRARYAIPTDALPERPSPLGDLEAEHIGLWQAVAALPERQRSAVAYHYLGGFSHVETAELIGGSPDSVRRASADGIKRLKQNFFEGESPQGARP